MELYEEELKAGDEMWHAIADASPSKAELQPGIVKVQTKGISISQFMLENAELAKQNNLYLPSMMHPEHYSFKAEGGDQIIIETFGMYKYPAYMHLFPASDGFTPIPLDDDTSFAMTGYTHLVHDDFDTKIVGMHQFKEREDGLEAKLGVFLPKAAPREMLEGHKWHLLVEFNNCLHAASEIEINSIQELAL